MIPESLTLKGFISYREKQTLDFRCFHVALITGENGNGKSSLLDGITFALFGLARGVEGTRKGVADLVTNGENSLYLRFQFLQDGKRYAVTRKFDKIKNSSNVILEQEKDGIFANISENSIRETDRKIMQILRMNYETFLITSFILQGKSDYFTTMNSTERIEVMKEMLFLNLYERAREVARERINNLKSDINAMQKLNETIRNETNVEQEVREKLEGVKREKDAIEENLALLKKRKAELDDKRIEKEKLHTQLKEKHRAYSENANRLNEKKEKAIKLEQEIAEYRSLLERQDEIRASYKEYVDIKARYEKMLARKNELESLLKSLELVMQKVESDRKLIEQNAIEKKKNLHELKEKATFLRKEISKNEKESSEKEAILVEVKDRAKEISAELEQISGKLKNKMAQKEEKQNLVSELSRIKERVKEREESTRRQIAEVEKAIDQLDSLLKAAKVEEAERECKTCAEVFESLKSKKEKAELEEQNLIKEMQALNLEMSSFDEKIRALDEKLDLLKEGEGKCPLCGSPLDEMHRREILEDTERQRKVLEEKSSSLIERISLINKRIAQIEKVTEEAIANASKKYEEARVKYERLKSANEEKEIQKKKALEKRQLLIQELEKIETEEEIKAIKTLEGRIAALGNPEIEMETLNAEKNRAEAIQKELSDKVSSLITEISVLKSTIENARKTAEEIEQQAKVLEAEVEALEYSLKSMEYEKPHKDEIEKLKAQISGIEFSEDDFKRVSRELEEKASVEVQAKKLEEAILKSESLLRMREDLLSEIRILEDKLKFELEAINAIRSTVNKFDGIEDECSKLQKQIDEIAAELKKKEQEFYVLSQSLKRIEERRAELQENEKAVGEKQKKLAVLQVCENMFGKEGIPIYLINSVIPRIEEYSNELLSAMSGGRMRVKFNTLRETKTGEKTTLEINVYDSGERRRYELFSGGEQFRINLAIRIGISRFMSSIVNSPLEMLVIDEGFGSQDETGKERILTEINTIKNLFKKVLVITHMGDVKENFPYEIRVVKDSRSSRLLVA